MSKKQITNILTVVVAANVIATMGLFWQEYRSCKGTTTSPQLSSGPKSISVMPSGHKIGVINVEKILSGSQAAAAINKQVEELRNNFQKWGETKEKIIHEKETTFVKEQPKMSPQEAAKQEKELKQYYANFQHEVMEKKQQMEAATHEGVNQIRNKIVQIAKDIAVKEGLSHVLADTFLVYFHEGTDLTDKVLPELNKLLPSVKIELQNPPKQ